MLSIVKQIYNSLPNIYATELIMIRIRIGLDIFRKARFIGYFASVLYYSNFYSNFQVFIYQLLKFNLHFKKHTLDDGSLDIFGLQHETQHVSDQKFNCN